MLLCENHQLSKFIIFGNIFRQNPASFLNSCDNFLAIGDERGYGENMENYSLSQNSRSRPSAANLDGIGSFTKNDVISNFSLIPMCQFSRILSNQTRIRKISPKSCYLNSQAPDRTYTSMAHVFWLSRPRTGRYPKTVKNDSP